MEFDTKGANGMERVSSDAMTHLEIIELTDAREPNHYDTQQKLRWLEALQERMEKEAGAAAGRSPYPSGAFEAEICVNYLIAQINAANGETERYNRAITLFNEMYAAYLAHLIRRSHGLKSNFSI